MRLRFLGTGTSFGIPVIGCECEACTSSDPRDRRLRHGALLQNDEGTRNVLIDTPPELRLQLLAAGIKHIDAVWYTHGHADHTHGIDDLRVFSRPGAQPLPTFADAANAEFMRHKFAYVFDEDYQPIGGPKVNLDLQVFADSQPIAVAGFTMLPLALPHGDVLSYGFRCGNLGYITDAKTLTAQAQAALRGVKVLVLNALWFGPSHATHFTVEEAVRAAEQLGAEQTYLTHLTHRVTHEQLLRELPPQVRPAYDGLVVEV
ncbi:MAG TPA: MBL fold metallo-hydrolase [Longimicrobiales bacterium]|nr:MBL fold metallo-hydrolase [Longimicrobiales bacterium]